MKIIALIPARGGSKGIPHKNIMQIAGKPLIGWSIDHAMDSKWIDHVLVSTEDDEIAEVAETFGAEVIDRPEELAQDDTPTEPVMLHVADELGWKFDYMVLLQPTSPIRPGTMLDMAITRMLTKRADSLLTLHREHGLRWGRDTIRGMWFPIDYSPGKRPQRQDFSPFMVENGNLYVTSKEILKEKECRLGGHTLTHPIPRHWGLEVDEPDDVFLVEQVLLNV